MVGYEFLDHDAIGEIHIGISVADATDYTKSESDLVLTRPALIPVFSAVQISRKICQMMRRYTVGHSDAFRGLISDNIVYGLNEHGYGYFTCTFKIDVPQINTIHQLSIL